MTQALLRLAERQAPGKDAARGFADKDRQPLHDTVGDQVDGRILMNTVGFHDGG